MSHHSRGASRCGSPVSGRRGRALAAAVAVLGDGAELAVAARLAGVGEEAARAAAAELVAADLFEDDPLLRFRHPLIRAAVAERLPAVERGDAHRRAARLLAERGRPRGVVAAHLLAAPTTGGRVGHRDTAHGRARSPRAGRAGARRDVPAPSARRGLAGPRDPCRAPPRARAGGACGRVLERAGPLREAWEASGDGEIAFELGSMLAEQTRWAEGAAVVREALARADDRELELRLRALAADCVRMDPSIGGHEPEELLGVGEDARRQHAGGTRGRWPRRRSSRRSTPPPSTRTPHCSCTGGGRRRAGDATGVVSNLIRAGRLDDAEGSRRRCSRAPARRPDPAPRDDALDARLDLGRPRKPGGGARRPRGRARARPAARAARDGARQPAAALLALVVAEQGELERADDLLTAHGLQATSPSSRS